MCTIEIKHNIATFKSLEKKHCNMIDNGVMGFDTFVSMVVLNEKDEIIVKVIAKPMNNQYQQGKGCYISEVKYPINLENYMLRDILPSLTSAVRFKTTLNGENLEYVYDYIWFQLPNIPNSVLAVFYSDAEIYEGTYTWRFPR